MDSVGIQSAFPQAVRRCLGFALALSFGLWPLQSATLERLTLDDLIGKSTSIVRGTVTGSYAAFRGPVIYTHYSVQVSEQLKGSSQTTVDVVVPGGTANNLRQIFAGAPQVQAGDRFVFFLWTGSSGLTQIMGLTQGLFQISAGASDDPQVTRPASSELMLDPGNGRPVKDQTLVMSLSALRSLIANGLNTGATQ